MRFSRQIGGSEMVIECDPRLKGPAEALLDRLAGLNERGPALTPGSTIQYGWSLLTLRLEKESLQVCEPDFVGDALHNFSSNLDITLAVLEQQSQVLRRTGLPGVDVYFADEVFVRGEALSEASIFLSRQQPKRPGDSGWYIGNPHAIEGALESDEYQVIQVFEIYQHRPSVLQVLANSRLK
jgi:hypothetical protein